jgi:hypothetical protein
MQLAGLKVVTIKGSDLYPFEMKAIYTLRVTEKKCCTLFTPVLIMRLRVAS